MLGLPPLVDQSARIRTNYCLSAVYKYSW